MKAMEFRNKGKLVIVCALIIASLMQVNCRTTNQGKVRYVNGKQTAATINLKCSPPPKTYAKSLEFVVKASLDSLKLLSKTQMEVALNQKISTLAQYTSEGLDKALFLYQMCIMVNNTNMSAEQTSELLKIAASSWDENGEIRKQLTGLSKNLQELKSYQHYSTFNILGQPFNAGFGISIESDLIKRMTRVLNKSDKKVELKVEKSTFYALDSITKAYPNFPFGFYFLALLDKSYALPSWRKNAERAIEILNVTTSIEGHHNHHDMALKNLIELFKE